MMLSYSSLIIALSLATAFINGQLDDCFQDDNPAVRNCYSDQGLVPPGTSGTDQPVADVEDLDEFCKNTTAFRVAYACESQVNYDCVTAFGSQFGNYVPSVAKADEYVKRSCQNLTFWDQACVLKNIDSVTRCTEQKLARQGNANVKNFGDLVCTGVNFGLECTVESLKTCGCFSTQLVTDVLRGPAYPPGCGSPKFEAVQCDDQDPNQFVNAATSIEGKFFSLCLAAFTWMFVSIRLLN